MCRLRIPRATTLLVIPLLMAMSMEGSDCSGTKPYYGPVGVEGRISFDVIDNATGELAEEAIYSLTRVSDGETVREGKASKSGMTRIRGLDEGGYDLRVTKDGHVGVRKGFSFRARRGEPPSVHHQGVRFYLMANSSALELQIVEPSGQPLTVPALVSIYHWGEPFFSEEQRSIRQYPLLEQDYTADEEGRLLITGLPAIQLRFGVYADSDGDGFNDISARVETQLIDDDVRQLTVQLEPMGAQSN